PNLEMQMGSPGTSGIPGIGNYITFFDGECRFIQIQFQLVLLSLVHFLPNILGKGRSKFAQMSIYGDLTVVMSQVKNIAISKGGNLHPLNKGIGSSMHR